jgi:hypothetical protein
MEILDQIQTNDDGKGEEKVQNALKLVQDDLRGEM